MDTGRSREFRGGAWRVAGAGRLDRLGAAAPLVCAAHCMLGPVLAGLAPWLAYPAVELPLLASAGLVAGWAVARQFRVHRTLAVWLPLGLGIGAWAGAALVGHAGVPGERTLAVLGGLLIAAGTLWSGRLLRSVAAHSCGCPACED
jgi:hypothetical protein